MIEFKIIDHSEHGDLPGIADNVISRANWKKFKIMKIFKAIIQYTFSILILSIYLVLLILLFVKILKM